MAGLAAGPALASTHAVQAGDTLSGIAASAGVPLSKVEAANQWIKNPNLIYVGQNIKVPDGRSGITPIAPTYYRPRRPPARRRRARTSRPAPAHPGSQHRHINQPGHLVGQHRHLHGHVVCEQQHRCTGVVPAVRGLA